MVNALPAFEFEWAHFQRLKRGPFSLHFNNKIKIQYFKTKKYEIKYRSMATLFLLTAFKMSRNMCVELEYCIEEPPFRLFNS